MSRNWTRDIRLPLANRYITDHWSSGTSVQHGLSYTFFSRDVKSGQSNPKYRQQIAAGTNAGTPYTRICVNEYRPFRIRGTSLWKSGSYWIRGSGMTTGFWSYSSHTGISDNAAVKDAALAKLKQKLSTHVGQANAVVPLVEIRELHGLATYAVQLAGQFVISYADIRRKRKGSIKDVRKRLYDAWLTWSFGVAPLIGDIHHIGQAIAGHLARSDHTVRLEGLASHSWADSPRTTTMTALPQSGALNIVQGVFNELSYRYIAGFDLRLLSGGDSYGSLPEKLGFELDSVPSILWELLPFSWVADYFTTIGDCLGDTLVLPPGSTNYVILDTIHKRKMTNQVYYSRGMNNFVSTSETRNGYLELFMLRREVVGSLPRVGLHFKTSTQTGVNSVNRLLNLISVLKR